MKRDVLDEILADLGRDSHVAADRISEHMLDQTEIFVKYARPYHQAVKDCKLLEFKIETVEARIGRQLDASHSRVTERMVRVACHQDEVWRRMKQDLIEAEDCRDTLETVLKAMVHRKEMLVNLGATVREEMRSFDVHVNKEPTNRRRYGSGS